MEALYLFLMVIVLLMIGVPIAVGLGLSSITFLMIYSDASLASVAQTLFNAFSSFPLVFVYTTPVSPCCFSLSSSPLVANSASIFPCFRSFILELLFSEILPPFSVSLVLPVP